MCTAAVPACVRSFPIQTTSTICHNIATTSWRFRMTMVCLWNAARVYWKFRRQKRHTNCCDSYALLFNGGPLARGSSFMQFIAAFYMLYIYKCRFQMDMDGPTRIGLVYLYVCSIVHCARELNRRRRRRVTRRINKIKRFVCKRAAAYS